MNRAILIGNLTKDPELRVTQSGGIPVCSFTIAVNRRATNAQGEREADFIPIVTWRGLAENCSRYLRKGSQVAVCGAIQTRNYEASDGSRRYVTEVIAEDVQFLNRIAGSDSPMQDHVDHGPVGMPASGIQPVEDDDLPF